MTLPIFPGLAFALILFLTGCNKSDEFEDEFSLNGTLISMTDIAGDWNAAKALFASNATGPVMEVDVVAEGGSVTMQIQENGRFSVTVTPQGEVPETSAGRLAFDEDLLVISFDEDPEEYEYFGIFHDEPNLQIQGGPVYESYDYDGDGRDEDSTIEFEFVRN